MVIKAIRGIQKILRFDKFEIADLEKENFFTPQT